MLLTDFRQQYPEYNDMNDATLASSLYRKHYSDMPEQDFYKQIGYQQDQTKVDRQQKVQGLAQSVLDQEKPSNWVSNKLEFMGDYSPEIPKKLSAGITGFGHGMMDSAQGISQMLGADSTDPNAPWYQRGKADADVARKLYADENLGLSAMAGQMGGFMADPVGAAIPMSKGTSLARMAKTGAAAGAVAGGLGYVDETAGQSRLTNATMGMGLGGLLTPAAHIAGKAIGNTAKGHPFRTDNYPSLFDPAADIVSEMPVKGGVNDLTGIEDPSRLLPEHQMMDHPMPMQGPPKPAVSSNMQPTIDELKTPSIIDPSEVEPMDAGIKIAGMNHQKVHSFDIGVNPKELQFKKDTIAETGEQTPLTGEWNPRAAGTVTVWKDKSGKIWAVNGHHRVALANRTGGQDLLVNVIKETDGNTIQDARRLGAELNIMEGRGTIYDHADFFKETPELTAKEAGKKGLAGRGFILARQLSNDAYAAFRSGKIDDRLATGIAKGSLGDEGLAYEGLKFIERNPKSKEIDVEQYLKTLSKIKPADKTGLEQSDIFFSADNQALQKTAERLSKAATDKIHEIQKDITALASGKTVDRAERASKGGIKVNTDKAQKKLAELKVQKTEWDHWQTNPKLFKEAESLAGLSSKPDVNKGGTTLHSNPVADPEVIKSNIQGMKDNFTKFTKEKIYDPIIAKNAGSSLAGGYGATQGYANVDEDAPVSEKIGAALTGAVLGVGAVQGGKQIVKMKWGQEGLNKANKLLFDNYGLPTDFINDKKRMVSYKNSIASQYAHLADIASKLPLKGRVALNNILTGETAATPDLAVLSKDVRDTITKYGQQMVDYGLLDIETFQKNTATYLHRSYASKLGNKSVRGIVKNIKMIGDTLKPRGQILDVPNNRLEKVMADGQGWETFGKAKKKGYTRIRRQYTKAERTAMGEIEDAAYNIAETGRLMSNDIATYRFFDDVAKKYGADEPMGEDWIQMSGNAIDKTKIKEFGNLANKWVPKEIGEDLRLMHEINIKKKKPWVKAYLKMNSWWKVSKTALNPVVHNNNIQSNFGLYYLSDAKWKHLVTAAKDLKKAANGNLTGHYKDAMEHGVFDADMATNELQAFKNSWLEKAFSDSSAKGLNPIERALKFIKKAPAGMMKMYQLEDHVFRLGVYIDAIEKGADPEVAATAARKQFIDYDINAQAINAARNLPLPFLAFTYRLIPILAETAITKPWKFAVMAGIGHAINAAGEYRAEQAGRDVKKERRLMPEWRKGTWWDIPFMPPKLIANPLSSDPQYAYGDVTRSLLGGDIYEQGGKASDWPFLPQPLQPSGGALGSIAFGMAGYDRFTGKKYKGLIDGETMRNAKIKAGRLAMDFLPNFPLPGIPGVPETLKSYSTRKIEAAQRGTETPLGDRLPVWQAVAQSFGFKIRPADVEKMSARVQYEYDKKIRVVMQDIRTLQRDMSRGMVTQESFDTQMENYVAEIQNFIRLLDRKLNGKKKEKTTPPPAQSGMGLMQSAGIQKGAY